jgi:hypothetical protein
VDLGSHRTWVGRRRTDDGQHQTGRYDSQGEGQMVSITHDNLPNASALPVDAARLFTVDAARLLNPVARDISAVHAGIGSGDPQLVRPGVGQMAHPIRPNRLGGWCRTGCLRGWRDRFGRLKARSTGGRSFSILLVAVGFGAVVSRWRWSGGAVGRTIGPWPDFRR